MSKTNLNSDTKLVIDFQNGNQQALNQLVRRWHKPFCEKAYWLVKDADEAKDIAQDSWSVIINKIEGLEKPESFASWSLRIVCNKSIDWLNKQSRNKKHLEHLKREQSTDIDEHYILDEKSIIKSKLMEAFKILPKHQQVVLQLFYKEEYSLKEISTSLNISVGTTKSRLFHGREKLKQLLKQYSHEK
ncbi:MAG: RNA polymerase sigma factor [Jejuia sp.]